MDPQCQRWVVPPKTTGLPKASEPLGIRRRRHRNAGVDDELQRPSRERATAATQFGAGVPSSSCFHSGGSGSIGYISSRTSSRALGSKARRDGVAEGVKAGPPDAGGLAGRREHPCRKVVGIEHRAGSRAEHELVLRGVERPETVSQVVRDRHVAP
jgi:hypothetical protein